MKRTLLSCILALIALPVCRAQNVRFGPYELPSVSSLYSPLLQANLPPNSPVLAVCHSPANQVPCTNYATTFQYNGTACPNGAQDTPDPNATTAACQVTGDAQGNIAWWAPAGQYDFTVCIQTTCLLYTVTQGSGGGGTGTVTDVATGAGLTGGPCTTTCTVSIGTAAVTNAMLANPSVTVNGTTCTLGSTCTPSAGGGGNPTIDNCTPDETGNSFPTVTSLTNYFLASWQFVFSTTTYFNCTVYIPTAQSGATVAVDVWSSDSTAGHTASITYADGVINSGTMNIGALTAAANQTFTTTSTANNRVTKTFNVQSTLSNGSILVIQIGTAPTGTAPTANINVYPHFVL